MKNIFSSKPICCMSTSTSPLFPEMSTVTGIKPVLLNVKLKSPEQYPSILNKPTTNYLFKQNVAAIVYFYKSGRGTYVAK